MKHTRIPKFSGLSIRTPAQDQTQCRRDIHYPGIVHIYGRATLIFDCAMGVETHVLAIGVVVDEVGALDGPFGVDGGGEIGFGLEGAAGHGLDALGRRV